jgi:hypothetical protein
VACTTAPDAANTDNESDSRTPCTREFVPVCGEVDGIQITFSNECEANNENAQNIVEGACVEEEVSLEGACLSFDGTWLEDSQECEGMGQTMCEDLGGSWNGCASACRNNPDAQICTLQCVIVCDFDAGATTTESIEEDESSIETFSIASQTQECDAGAGKMDCMVVNDELFYSTIEGFTYQAGYTYELLVEVSDRENVPMDASSKEYTLVEEVSRTADTS